MLSHNATEERGFKSRWNKYSVVRRPLNNILLVLIVRNPGML